MGKIKAMNVKAFTPLNRSYKNLGKTKNSDEGIIIPGINLKAKEEVVLILTAK
jgi:hypothetical protein